MQSVEIQQQQQQFESLSSSSFQQQSTVTSSSSTQQVLNGSFEETGSVQGSSSSSSLLQKIMTPANNEYDSGSLKRRDPRKMFTDSSFYSAKHHPTVADQVEMAHKLSSALFKDDNKNSKGQQMYLNRAKKSGEGVDLDMVDTAPKHDQIPNMKLVMNPEGKVHEWNDYDPAELPNASLLAGHAVPASLPSPEIAGANPMIDDLNNTVGRGGELFAKRRKRAENWVVDEASVGVNKPSAAADHFMQQQLAQQQQFQQQQQLEQSVQQQQQQQLQQQQAVQQQEKLVAQQQFRQQQQFKQEQFLEIQQQQAAMFSDQTMELPPNFKHTSLKGRSYTPSLDLGIHNVQGINVWANSAPRGWKAQKSSVKAGPPSVSVCPATPSNDQHMLQQQQQLEQQQQLLLEQQQQQIMLEQQQQLNSKQSWRNKRDLNRNSSELRKNRD